MAPQRIIGLTGNIATGKSAIMKFAAEKGALTVDADRVVHDLLNSDTVVQEAVEAAFGAPVRLDDGRIDRAALGHIVFSDPVALQNLEGLLHPATREEIGRRVKESTAEVVMIEAIKLLEGPLAAACHEVWVADCSPECQKQRLLVCRGMDAATADTRIAAQSPQTLKVAEADVVINTEGLMTDTKSQFDEAWTAALRRLSDD